MRIIGQCNRVQFDEIVHLADILDRAEELDTSTFNNKQKIAFRFIGVAFSKGIKWRLLYDVVREVLFWGEGDEIKRIEIRFTHNPEKRKDIDKFKQLWMQR